MKKFIPLLFAFLLIIGTANAAAWRVNNNGSAANFTSLVDAVASSTVQNGDIIYLEGSGKAYDGVNLKKKLTIIGPGYFLHENANTGTNILAASLAYIVFSPGSEGSQLMGVNVNGLNTIQVQAGNILIKRCLIDYDVFIGPNITNIRILQNFFRNVNHSAAVGALSYSNTAFAADVVFDNNICQRVLVLNNSYSILECKNNVFDFPSVTGSNPSLKMIVGNFQNNIIAPAAAIVDINNQSNRNASYNISASANNQLGTGNNNIVVTNLAALFVDQASNSTDGDYQLRAKSSGSANGSDGTDRGVFGGAAVSNHYTLSGLPPVPVIYDINTTGVTSTATLPVTVKAKVIK